MEIIERLFSKEGVASSTNGRSSSMAADLAVALLLGNSEQLLVLKPNMSAAESTDEQKALVSIMKKQINLSSSIA